MSEIFSKAKSERINLQPEEKSAVKNVVIDVINEHPNDQVPLDPKTVNYCTNAFAFNRIFMPALERRMHRLNESPEAKTLKKIKKRIDDEVRY